MKESFDKQHSDMSSAVKLREKCDSYISKEKIDQPKFGIMISDTTEDVSHANQKILNENDTIQKQHKKPSTTKNSYWNADEETLMKQRTPKLYDYI